MAEVEVVVVFPCEKISPEKLPGYAVGVEDIIIDAFEAVVRTSDDEVKVAPLIVYWDDGGPSARLVVDGELVDYSDVPMVCTDARCSTEAIEEAKEMLREGVTPRICITETY